MEDSLGVEEGGAGLARFGLKRCWGSAPGCLVDTLPGKFHRLNLSIGAEAEDDVRNVSQSGREPWGSSLAAETRQT